MRTFRTILNDIEYYKKQLELTNSIYRQNDIRKHLRKLRKELLKEQSKNNPYATRNY